MANKKDDKTLEQTKGTFKAIGKVVGVDKERFYTEGEVSRGANEGKEYRSMKFGVQVSPHQTLFVEMFGMQPTTLTVFKTQEKDSKGKQVRVTMDYDDYLAQLDELDDDKVITYDSAYSFEGTGKDAKRVHRPKFDTIEALEQNLENGMSVYVNGRISHSQYTSKNGDLVNQTKYELQNIFLAEEVDFEDPKFNQYAVFTEETVLSDVIIDKENEKATILGRAISYQEEVFPASYTVSYAKDMNGYDETLTGEEAEKNAEYVKSQISLKTKMIGALKKLSSGDLIKIDGKIMNRVIIEEIEDEEEDELLADLMGNSKKKVVRNYESTLSVTGIPALTRERYTDEDFYKALNKNTLVEEEVEDEEDDFMKSLKGDTKKEDDPFGGDSFSIDDDLPF